MFNCWLFYPYTEISIEHRTNFPRSGHNLPTPEPSPHAPALVSTAALRRPTPTDSWLLGRILFRVGVRHGKSWPGKFDAENFPWNQFQSLLFFRSLFFFFFNACKMEFAVAVICSLLVDWLISCVLSTIESRFFFTHAIGQRVSGCSLDRRAWSLLGERGKIGRGKVDRARNYV